jgi:competence protein ComEA
MSRHYYPNVALVTVEILVCTIAFAASITLSASQASQPQPAQDPFPETAGKPALLKVCGSCHDAEMVIGSLRTRQEWSDVIDQMASFGAEATPQEFEEILSYLAKHFSPIKINKSVATELASTLDVPAAVAEAIVAFREKNGDFKSIDDLVKVPGLDGGRIEARKARVVF